MTPFLDAIAAVCLMPGKRYSDLILQPGANVHAIANGLLEMTQIVMTEDDVQPLLSSCTSTRLTEWPTDERHSVMIGGVRFRALFARSEGHKRAVMRILVDDIKNPAQLGIPPAVVNAAMTARSGIVFVCGETGAGKSMTIASLLQQRADAGEHIITIEEALEYRFRSKYPLQFLRREVGPGKDTPTYAAALTAALGQAPRIIMVGEINDPVTAFNAISAATTGHLVFTSLHTGSAPETIASLLKWIPSDLKAIAQQTLGSSLIAVVCQRLVDDGNGDRFAIHEVMMATPAVRNLIQRGDLSKLDGEMRGGDNQTFEQSFERAVADRRLSPKHASAARLRFLGGQTS